MAKRSMSFYGGIVLVILGLLFLLGELIGAGAFWAIAWPTFILLPGLFLYWLWQATDKRKNWGLLIPSTILIFLAGGFFLNMVVTELFHYGTIWAWTSFMYSGAVAAAFWIAWMYSGNKGLLIVARVLTIISVVVFLVVGFFIIFLTILPATATKMLWPIILILIGLFTIAGPAITKIFWKNGRFLGKSEEDWKKWGENLGEEIEKQVKDK